MLRWCNSDSRRCSVFRVQRTACKNTNRPECIATRAHFLAWNIWGVKDPMTSVFRDIFWSFYRDWWRCPQKGWGKKWIWRYQKKTKYSTSWKIGFRGWFSYFFPCKKEKKGKQHNNNNNNNNNRKRVINDQNYGYALRRQRPENVHHDGWFLKFLFQIYRCVTDLALRQLRQW